MPDDEEVELGDGPMRSPIIWYGAKAKLADWIVGHFPPHKLYCEVFGGSAAVLFTKAPADAEVLNDIDDGLVTFYRVLRDPALFPHLFLRATLTPYARSEWRWARDTWATTEDLVERAARWFYVSRASWAGKFGQSWSHHAAAAHVPTQPDKWAKAVDLLPAFHQRLRHVQVECLDWQDCLRQYDGPDTLFYLDPPYVLGTRVAGPQYQHEFTDADHAALVETLGGLQGMAILSGYDHPLYAPLDAAGWQRVERTTLAWSANARVTPERSTRREVLWLNPAVMRRQRQLSLWDVGKEAADAAASPD